MNNNNVITERKLKLQQLKVFLENTNQKLMLLTKNFEWDFQKLSKEEPLSMATCSINPQHRVPHSKIKIHEEKCSWKNHGYAVNDKTFSEHSGTGSFVTLTPESVHLITKNAVSFTEKKCFRAVPQTSANFDQNFSREEKLAIYDYVIANTQKQVSHSDLWSKPIEKSEEKKEMAAWEIAAAKRDAKRRRASYRNKVHTNRKTLTEIFREVIGTQMEALTEEISTERAEKTETDKASYKKSSPESRECSSKRKIYESTAWRNQEDRNTRRNHDRHSKPKEHKRYPSDTGSETKSRSRSHDKYRKWKSYEGRSHSHRSSHTHSRK